ncbi:MAG: hypothetical protein R8K49_06420 [Mariprofundaceae bacterium]
MDHLTRFYFALTPRMQAFLDLRHGLHCLELGLQQNSPYACLQAVADIRSSLLGEGARKPALPELMGLMKGMRAHLDALADKHPDFRAGIEVESNRIAEYESNVSECIVPAMEFVAEDGLVNAWNNCVQKQDWLGHKLHLPQVLPVMWKHLNMSECLREKLQDLNIVVQKVHAMLNDFVPWAESLAQGGSDQVVIPRGENLGLLIIGLTDEWVKRGVFVDFSGNHLAVRVRFQQWHLSAAQTPIEEEVPYQMMLVPIV